MELRSCALAFALFATACDKPRGTDPGLGLRENAGHTLRSAFESLAPGGSGRVTPLYGNVDSWAVRWRELERAKESIDVVTFILHDDLFGRAFLGMLARKADQGVRVRLLVDSTGTIHAAEDRIAVDALASLDRRANVDVRSYNPVSRAVPDVLKRGSLLPAVAANHDKVMIIDGRRSIMGGRNFADEYFADPADDPVVFFDKDVLIESKDVARVLTGVFERELFDASTLSIEDDEPHAGLAPEAPLVAAAKAMDDFLAQAPLAQLPPPVEASRVVPVPEQRKLPEDDVVGVQLFPRMRGALQREPPRSHQSEIRVLDSCSQAGCRKNDINEGLARLVESAREEIVIENPYLMLSDAGLRMLREAAERGVRITLLTNSPASSDNAVTQAFFLEQWPTILATVPHMRIYVMAESHNVHGKLVVVDGSVTAIGSYNLDVLSAAINSEVVAVMRSEAFAQHARADVFATIARGAPHIVEYTIERDRKGKPVLDDDGRPREKVGPSDHCDPQAWPRLQLYRKALDVRGALPDLSPLL